MRIHSQNKSQPQPEASPHLSRLAQHTIENHAARALANSNTEDAKAIPVASATTHFTHDFSRIPMHSKAPVRLQAKLKVNTLGDSYEQEADRVSEEVLSMPEPQGQRACACGNHSIGGGECSECGRKNGPNLQSELKVSEPGAGYEQEVHRIVNQVMATPAHHAVSETQPHIQRLAGQSIKPLDAVPVSVEETLAAPGRPLEPALRQDMEHRFGHDFSHVRLHSDAAAEQSARQVNAHAYTVGRHIVFGAGRFTPATREGRRLLAHELTHVVQQSSGNIFLGKKGAEEGKDKLVTKKVRIPRGTTSVQEFRRYAEFKIFGLVLNLNWTAHSGLDEIYGDITKHIGEYIAFTFPASLLESKGAGSDAERAEEQKTSAHAYMELDDDERKGINEEIDKRYYASIKEEPGAKIKAGEEGKIAIWNSFKQQVLADKRKIEALPDDIKSILFAGGPDSPVLTPDNYTQVLRIAQKLAMLKPETRREYIERISASTTSLDTLESSVNSYLKLLAEREKEEEALNTAAKPLLGAEDLYTLVKKYKKQKHDAEMALSLAKTGRHQAAEHKDEIEAGIKAADAEMLSELKKKGFNSVEEFDTAVEAYRVAFRTQAVNLALDVLAHYDHMLFEEREKFQKPGAVAAIAQSIAATKASALYERARDKKREAKNLHFSHEPKETWWIAPAREAEEASTKAHDEAESKVKSASGNDPLIAERGTDREKLAGLDAEGLEAYLFELLDERAEDVRKARQDFKEDPDRVFKLPDLVAATKKIQNVDSTLVYGQIIDDYISDEAAKHFLSEVVKGILVLALAFLVPVGGWVAAAAIIGTAAISTYQAYAAYKEYEEQETYYNLHFLSEEPSLFWVGVAIVAAAFDLGVLASVVVKGSAAALKSLEGPLLEFSKLEAATESDLAKLISKIESTKGLEAKVMKALEREAAASIAAKKALKDFGGKAYSFMPGAEIGLAVQGFRVLYYSVKRGINNVIKLRADAKLMEALGDITRLTGAERAELETAFEEVKQLVKVGSAKSMDEASLLGYIDRWAINRGKSGFKEKLFEEMKAWKPLTAKQQKALKSVKKEKDVVDALYKEKNELISERSALRSKQKNPQTATVENQDRIKEIDKRLIELEPSPKGQTTRIKETVRNADGELEEKIIEVPAPTSKATGEIERAEGALAQAEKIAEQAGVSLYARLRAAAPSNAAKERALRGVSVDQVGPLIMKPGPLTVDHIVSVREVSDMDGFAKLPWKDQKAIVDMKENLVPMDKSANFSKGDRTWKSWNQASHFYEKSTIDIWIEREAKVRSAILAEIQKRLPKSTGLKP